MPGILLWLVWESVSLGLSQASLEDSFTLAGWGSFSPLELGTVRKGHGWEWTLGTSRSSTYSVALLINGRLRYGLVMGNRQQSAAPPKRSVLLSSENAVGTRLWQPHYWNIIRQCLLSAFSRQGEANWQVRPKKYVDVCPQILCKICFCCLLVTI